MSKREREAAIVDERRYVVVAKEPGSAGGLAAAVERALSMPGVTGKVTNRFDWGIVVKASTPFEELIHRKFPSLEICEEVQLHMT